MDFQRIQIPCPIDFKAQNYTEQKPCGLLRDPSMRYDRMTCFPETFQLGGTLAAKHLSELTPFVVLSHVCHS